MYELISYNNWFEKDGTIDPTKRSIETYGSYPSKGDAEKHMKSIIRNLIDTDKWKHFTYGDNFVSTIVRDAEDDSRGGIKSFRIIQVD